MEEIVLGLALICGVPPLAVLAHELGHAITRLLCGPGHVVAVAGRPDVRLRLGRLTIYFGFAESRGVDHAGVMVSDFAPTLRAERLVSSAGAIAGLLYLLAIALVLPSLPISTGARIIVSMLLVLLAINEAAQIFSNQEGTDGWNLRVYRYLERTRAPWPPDTSTDLRGDPPASAA